jgi:hypothetical protein
MIIPRLLMIIDGYIYYSKVDDYMYIYSDAYYTG